MKISSNLLRTLTMVGALALCCSYTSIASAAQGCGHGFHRNIYGRCVMNYPGVRFAPAPYYRHYRHCWRNYWGHVRCR